jgi:hypothetical protein
MPDRHLAVLVASLWDLRAQCEAQIRALTDAQRQLDGFRDSRDRETRERALGQFHDDVSKVVKRNAEIRSTLRDVKEHAESLSPAPPRNHRA